MRYRVICQYTHKICTDQNAEINVSVCPYIEITVFKLLSCKES